jgi:PIN domain nuclease of toxin-antitoxin system
VRLLLDTHAVLWWFSDDPRLSAAARSAIADIENEVIVSAVLGYEIVYKQTRGRLPGLPENLPQRLLREGLAVLPITLEHTLAAAEFPGPHRDPWDRIMMAQALAAGCQVVTADPVFAAYGVPVLW